MTAKTKTIPNALPKFNTLCAYTDREAWLKSRQKGIGGSDIGTLMGHNPYNTRLNVYLSKHDSSPSEIPDNPFMKAGRFLEGAIGDLYADSTGYEVVEDKSIFIHKKYPFLLASVDRIIKKKMPDGSYSYGILEIKNIGGDSKSWITNKPPLMYYDQLQHYLSVLDLEWGAIAALVGGQDFQIHPYKRDDAYVEKMALTAKDFWENNVMMGIPPDPETSEDVLLYYPEALDGVKKQASQEDMVMHQRLQKVNADLNDLSTEKKSLEAKLKAAIGNAEMIVDAQGKPLVSWKNQTPKYPNYFDVIGFQKADPETYKKWTRSSPKSRYFYMHKTRPAS